MYISIYIHIYIIIYNLNSLHAFIFHAVYIKYKNKEKLTCLLYLYSSLILLYLLKGQEIIKFNKYCFFSKRK